MVDPIDPVSVKVNAGIIAEASKVEPVAKPPERRPAEEARAQAAALARAVHDPAPHSHETTPRPGFEVHLDGATLRIYSEMRDPDTKRVMLRIPTGYQPKVEPPRDYKPTEFET